MSLPSMTSKPGTHVIADPDAVPAGLPITRKLHETIVAPGEINPQSKTMRAVLAAIQELEATIVQNQENH